MQKRIEIGKPGGGFILSTACSIAPDVPRDNILALYDAVEEWDGIKCKLFILIILYPVKSIFYLN